MDDGHLCVIMLRRDGVSVLSMRRDVGGKSGNMLPSDGLKNEVDERYDGCEVSVGDVLLCCCCCCYCGFQLHVSNTTSLCSTTRSCETIS